jgi:hypothetical protein
MDSWKQICWLLIWGEETVMKRTHQVTMMDDAKQLSWQLIQLVQEWTAQPQHAAVLRSAASSAVWQLHAKKDQSYRPNKPTHRGQTDKSTSDSRRDIICTMILPKEVLFTSYKLNIWNPNLLGINASKYRHVSYYSNSTRSWGVAPLHEKSEMTGKLNLCASLTYYRFSQFCDFHPFRIRELLVCALVWLFLAHLRFSPLIAAKHSA